MREFLFRIVAGLCLVVLALIVGVTAPYWMPLMFPGYHQ